jgi:Flp pilus assembly protein TadG
LSRGQSLVELAICAPVVTLLALGAVALVQVADAKQGLEAATQAAVAAAARAPDAATAKSAAAQRFMEMASTYPLGRPVLRMTLGTFERGGLLIAESSASVELGWGGFLGLPNSIVLRATAETRVEAWRSRGQGS